MGGWTGPADCDTSQCSRAGQDRKVLLAVNSLTSLTSLNTQIMTMSKEIAIHCDSKIRETDCQEYEDSDDENIDVGSNYNESMR